MVIDTGMMLLILGVFFGFFAQTIVGFAAGMIAFPFLLTQYTLAEATAFLSTYMVVFSAILIYKNRKDIDKNLFKELAPGMTIGVLIGFLILKFVDAVWLEKLLGGFLIVYSIYEWKFQKVIVIPNKIFQMISFFGGVMTGIFSTGSAVYGPLVANRTKDGVVMRATLLGIFGISNFLRFPFVLFSSMLTKEIFIKSLILMPVFILAIVSGYAVYKYISEKLLRNLMLFFFIVSGLFLLLK
jgi:uncharacterized membrane protein YfcA